VHHNDLYFEIATLRGQDMHGEAAHERLLCQAQGEPRKRSDPRGDAGCRRLAVAILGLDVNSLLGALSSRRRRASTYEPGAAHATSENPAHGSPQVLLNLPHESRSAEISLHAPA
jgi:hypothetical protein